MLLAHPTTSLSYQFGVQPSGVHAATTAVTRTSALFNIDSNPLDRILNGMRVQMKIEELRAMVRGILSEAVRMNPRTESVVNMLNKADSILGPKTTVLFLRTLSKRISDSEGESIANEIRQIISQNPYPKQVARLRYAFDAAYEDVKDEVVAPSKIDDMISSTLKSAEEQNPQSFSIKSIAKTG